MNLKINPDVPAEWREPRESLTFREFASNFEWRRRSGQGRGTSFKELGTAWKYYRDNREHVLRIAKLALFAYPPTVANARWPQLWRSEHWRWFVDLANARRSKEG
jgi:hypothetical protein